MLKHLFNKYFIRPKFNIKGENNSVEIDKTAYLRKVKINIYGNNNKIFIDEWAYIHNSSITIGFPECPINNCLVKIGRLTTANSMDMQLGESDSEVIIGENCMISFKVEITCTDTHSILNTDGKLLNKGEKIEVGNNVWLCKNIVVLKNTKIPDNSVVAQGSIVTKKFDKTNIVIAGNPAKIVKEGIIWDRKRPEEYTGSKK